MIPIRGERFPFPVRGLACISIESIAGIALNVVATSESRWCKQRVASREWTENRFHRAAFDVAARPIVQRFDVHQCRAVDGLDRAVNVIIAVRVAHHERWCEHTVGDELLKKQSAILL